LRCPKCNAAIGVIFDAKMGERYYCYNCHEHFRPNFTEDRPAGVA